MTNPLNLAFIDKKPLAAARVLAALPVEEAAAFLGSIPTRYAVSVLAPASAWSASRLLLAMDPASIASVLRSLPYMDAVAILRLISPPERKPLLAKVSRRLRRDFVATMTFPVDTVGGQMTVEFIALEADHTVADATKVLASTSITTDVVFVVDEGRNYQGCVAVGALFRHSGDTPLSELASPDPAPLSARQTIDLVANLDAWDDTHFLPVVSRRRQLIGALSIKQLHSRRPAEASSTAQAGNSLVETFLGAAAELLRTTDNHQSESVSLR